MADIEYCEWMTGFPIKFYNFIASCETNGGAIELYSSAPLEINWGSGKFLSYEPGNIHGYQENTFTQSPVVIRSSEAVTEFRFGSGIDYDRAYLECHIHKAFDLISAKKLCYRLEEMHTFSFFGTNKVQDFSSAWEDCTEMTHFDGMDTTEAKSFYRSWKNCNKLTAFPSIYSRVSNTVEEAWMGCTAMTKFPVIGSELCTNFKSAWRGNVHLVDFPLIDTSAGENFDHAWAYCINLLDFPTLDYGSSLNMDYAFAYNYKIISLPTFNTKTSKSFNSTFEKCTSLRCIQGINTNGATRDNMVDIFKECCDLTAPHNGINPDTGEVATSEQERLKDGWQYTNQGECYFDTGRSVFYAVATTLNQEDDVCSNLNICTFTVEGGDVEINWGDGVFIPHNTGTITGLPIDTGIIHIKSEENITKITFDTDSYYTVSIKRGKTLLTLKEMCLNITKLVDFSIYGNIIATDYSSMLEGCSNLVSIDSIDWSYAETLENTMKNCSSLSNILDNSVMDAYNCTNFTSTFEGCNNIQGIGLINSVKGKFFKNMFKDCLSLACLRGINTLISENTSGMFTNTPSLVRPNENEQPNILAGSVYNNGGNCDAVLSLYFTATGDVEFTSDLAVKVDWGNGTYVDEGPGLISGTPVGTVYVFGDSEQFSFGTPTMYTGIIFVNGSSLTTLKGLCKDMVNLVFFNFYGQCNTESWEEAFMGCTSMDQFYASGYELATNYTNMFNGCSSLEYVGYMNTLKGIEFEYMFAGCVLLNLDEINTSLGQFAKNYKDCIPRHYDCATEILDCTVGATEQCSNKWDCLDEFACFGSSTMFEGWTALQVPSEADRIAISSQAHWKDGSLI